MALFRNTGSEAGQAELPEDVQQLFRAYRQTLEPQEPGADFMPALWNRIESRQQTTLSFGRVARSLVSFAGALSLLMLMLLSSPHFQVFDSQSNTYVDILAEADTETELLALAQGEGI